MWREIIIISYDLISLKLEEDSEMWWKTISKDFQVFGWKIDLPKTCKSLEMAFNHIYESSSNFREIGSYEILRIYLHK